MGDVGGREPGESLEAFNKRRKGTVGRGKRRDTGRK